MAKSSRGEGQQGNILVVGAISIWVLIMLISGGMVVAAAAGVVDTSAFVLPLPTGKTENTPTPLPPQVVEPASNGTPPAPSFAWEGLVTTPGEGALSVGETALAPVTTPGSAPMPEVPVTPTPHFSLPQTAFSEGPIVIGYSVKGLPLEAYRFGDGPVKRMIVAGIHGGYEANTIALADELIAYILEHPEIIPQTVTLYIFPNLNPDGYARAEGVDGRANANHVDLNRNFPINWEAKWSRHGCWNYRPLTGGNGPGSEPETQAFIAFASQVRPTAIISYHSAALGIFPGGEPADPESAQLAEALAAVSNYPYPPIDTGCFYTGTLPDWAVSMGFAAVDLELHTHKYTDFEENLEILNAFLEWRR